jgi:predicted transcriptional regulator
VLKLIIMQTSNDRNIRSTLRKWGLSDNEIIVYLATIKLGETNPYQLYKETKIPRTTVYDIILTLSLKGLIELEQSDGLTKQQTIIKAKNPSFLREAVIQKRDKLYSLEEELIQILPMLKSTHHESLLPPMIKYYPGIEGVYKMEENEKESLTISDVYCFEYDLPMDFPGLEKSNEIVNLGNRKRNKTRFKAYDLMPNSQWIRHVEQYQVLRDKNYYLNREVRLVDERLFDFAAKVSITKGCVRLYSGTGNEVWGLEIQSENLAKTFTSIFKTIWLVATPLSVGEILGWGKNEILDQQIKKGRVLT